MQTTDVVFSSVPIRLKDVLRRSRWILRSSLGRDYYHRPEIRRPITYLGGRPDTGFGAWAIDLEPLTPDSIIYSVGVGDDISFDLELIKRSGVTVHAFDPTPESHAWLARQTLPDGFVLHKLAVGDKDGTVDFYPHENPEWVAHSILQSAHTRNNSIKVPIRRLRTIMESLGHSRIDLLKLDIEGAEYSVIDDLVSSDITVGQLLVEFHHRFSGLEPEMTRRAVSSLREIGLTCFYVSANGEEYAFTNVSEHK